jgi:hypothetical protein
MTSERGSVTLWTLGLSVLLLLFGGLMVDFWRALALQRELAAVAGSAAIAAASGIDEEHYRATGEVLIDSGRARGLASSYADAEDVSLSALSVVTSDDRSSVTVEATDHLELGLLGVFVVDEAPLQIRAEATAVPLSVP